MNETLELLVSSVGIGVLQKCQPRMNTIEKVINYCNDLMQNEKEQLNKNLHIYKIIYVYT